MSERLRRARTLTRIGLRCIRLVIAGQKTSVPETIYSGFRELGGVYVKFLQLLVLRSETFQKLKVYDIYDVYDQVGYESIDIVNLLAREYGFNQQAIRLESDQPIAAGSFGQVYRARYGEQIVILKVLRPSVSRYLSFDLRLLKLCSKLGDLVSGSSAVSLRSIYREFSRVTRLETNYLLEADYATSMYERYANHPQIVIPKTYREYSTKRVICQEYVPGLPATDLIKLVQQGYDARTYVAQTLGSDVGRQLVAVGGEMLSGVFTDGFTYGDPHPGNLAFLPRDKVVIYDFGLPATAPVNTVLFRRLIGEYYKIYSGQPDLQSFSRVLLDMYGGDVIRAAHSLDGYYGADSMHLVDGILHNAGEVLEGEADRASHLLQNNKMMLLFSTVINRNNRYCLQYELDGPEIIRAGLLFIALVTSLGVKNEVLRDTYGMVLERTKTTPLHDGHRDMHPETAFEVLADWFDNVSYRNPYLYRRIKEGAHYV